MTKENYYQIEKEIYSIINSTYNYLEEKHFQEYVLLLARVEKIANEYHTESAWYYEIDNTRNRFLVTYLNYLYSSIENEIKYSIEEKEMLLNMQILIYSHAWEAKPFLKLLSQIMHIYAGKGYLHEINIDISKKNFIDQNILSFKNNELTNLIDKIYDNDKRNSFSHADYKIDMQNEQITFFKYGNIIQTIDFDSWETIFCKTILLNYYLVNILRERKRAFIEKYGNHPIDVTQAFKEKNIKYAITTDYRNINNEKIVEFTLHFFKV